MIVAVPKLTPVTIPEAEPTVATAGLKELHMPPVTASDNVEVLEKHTIAEPVIANGEVLTVTG